MCYHLYVLYMCTYLHIYCCADGIHMHVYVTDFLVLVFYMVVPVKLICNVQAWARPVYNMYPVLVLYVA